MRASRSSRASTNYLRSNPARRGKFGVSGGVQTETHPRAKPRNFLKEWRRARDSNPQGPRGPVDFKSTALPVEASPPCPGKPLPTIQHPTAWSGSLRAGERNRYAKPIAIVRRFRSGGTPMRVACLALVFAAVVSIAAGNAAAANYTQETLDRYLRIDYQVEPSAAQPVVSGYVYNMHPGLPADRLQLVIDATDASGKVVGSSTTWILGGAPVGSRGYFSASVVPAASYRVQVLFLDWGKGGGR